MPSTPIEPELVALRKLAQELAHARKERITSGHLLAAIASQPGIASDLLLERRLSSEVLLKAARANLDEEAEPLSRGMMRAREVASRMGAKSPGTLHLLLALIHDRSTGAHRALSQCGVDIARLRSSAMQLALGRVEPRRASIPPAIGDRIGQGGGVTISLFPTRSVAPSAPAKAIASRPATAAIPPARSPATTIVPILSTGLGPGKLAATPSSPLAPASPPSPSSHAAAVPTRPHAPPTARRRTAKLGTVATSLDASLHIVASREVEVVLDPTLFPTLSALGKNLTQLASIGKLEPVRGRETHIEHVLDVLAKRHAHNPILIGP